MTVLQIAFYQQSPLRFKIYQEWVRQLTSPSKHKVDSETELNSKIEQNKMLIDKVQKVLNIIKLGVQFPTASLLEQDYKLENTTSDVILREAKSEVETAVHMYEEFNADDLPLQESKSDINMDAGGISIEKLQEEALKARAEKSDVETAVRHIGETTSEETFKPPSTTDDDVNDEEELSKIDDVIKQNGLDDLKDINQERPLTRRNEDVKWTVDKFRTEPVMTDRYSAEMSDFDIVQAKLDTIHDTESESASDDMYIDSVTKEIPVTAELSDDHISNTDTYNIPETFTKKNVEHKQSEKGYVQENKSDIRNDFPFKSRIIDQDLRHKSDCNQSLCKNKHMSKIQDDSKRSKNSLNETNFPTSTQLDAKTNYPSNSESKRNKDVASNTVHTAECKDIACSTDDSGRGTDFTCNTEIAKCKDIASNTEQPAKLKNASAATENAEKRHAASNTAECKRNDFGSSTKPQQKDFACKVELRKGCRDAFCDTDYLKIKTSNAACYTDIRTLPAATQKCRLDGINMTYESVENINIPPNNHLKKSEVLQVQLLPPINIISLPTVQKIFQLHIDKYGQSHVAYQPSIKTVAYLEVRSPSYNKQSEVKVKTTNTLIDHRNYEHGFREIKKKDPSTLLRSPRRKCKFFIDHKYNLDYESGSEADKMIKSVNKTRYPNLCKIGVCSGDDGELFIEAKSAQETQLCEDGTWTYLTKYGTYLKRTCSDSSLVVKTIKGASAHVLASDSETNSRIESVSESNKICSSKNIYSSGNSSQWVGEFLSQNIDEKVYKTYIDPDGFSRRHSRWKYATEKTQTNLECFANRSSRDHRELKKSCKTIETQTQPWRPEPISKSTFTEHSSSIVSDQALRDKSKSFSTSDQNQQKSQSIKLKNSITNRTPIQRSLETSTKILQPKAAEGQIVKNPDTSVENFSPNPIRFSQETKIRNQEEKLNRSETSEVGSQNVESPDFSMKTNDNIQSLDKISLTITCSTDESFMKDSTNNPFVIEAFSKREANTNKKIYENLVKNVKQKNTKEDIPRKDITEFKSKRRNNEDLGIVEKSKTSKNKGLLERKTKTDSKNQQPSKENGYINKRTNYIPIEQHMLQGDSLLVDKHRKLRSLRNQHKEKNDLVDDIINKFRNVYMIDTDATHDTTDTKSLSEGEIRCYCSTSTGEIHDCIKINQKFQKPHSFQQDIGIAPIKKRRNYFNNWTTYYFNKYAFANNSSSTS